jgi:transposase
MKLLFYARLSRTQARSQRGTRAYQKKAFYRGAKVTAIGAISMNKVLALMTINDSMDGQAFAIFIQHFLCPQLWKGAVVVMDNLPAHKLASIKPMIESVGASIICLSPYSPDFNPRERKVVATKIFFAYVRSNYHVHDRSNNCSCPELNQSSTFKKLGKLIVVIVLHNSGNRCM